MVGPASRAGPLSPRERFTPQSGNDVMKPFEVPLGSRDLLGLRGFFGLGFVVFGGFLGRRALGVAFFVGAIPFNKLANFDLLAVARAAAEEKAERVTVRDADLFRLATVDGMLSLFDLGNADAVVASAALAACAGMPFDHDGRRVRMIDRNDLLCLAPGQTQGDRKGCSGEYANHDRCLP